jgi:hypothetical protein
MPDLDLDVIRRRHTKRYAMGRDETDPDIGVLIAEVERLRREGSPGVMHKMDRAFYDLTVKERDHERRRVDQLEAYKEFAESFAAKLRAVHVLLDRVDLASPGRMVIEVALVREAANTGVVPDLPHRKSLI